MAGEGVPMDGGPWHAVCMRRAGTHIACACVGMKRARSPDHVHTCKIHAQSRGTHVAIASLVPSRAHASLVPMPTGTTVAKCHMWRFCLMQGGYGEAFYRQVLAFFNILESSNATRAH